MFQYSSSSLAAVALLALVPVIASPADGRSDQAAGNGAPSAQYASEVPAADLLDTKDATALAGQVSLPIAQSVDEIVNQYLSARGGHAGWNSIVKVDYYGTRYVDCQHYPMEMHTGRPNENRTLVKTGDSSKFEGVRSGAAISVRGDPQGLGLEHERVLLSTFDFYGVLVDWDKKKYMVKRLGMEKLPGVLTWKLEVDRPDGYRQVLYLDSHYGDIVMETIMDTHGIPILEIARHDFRSVDGARFPFAVDYRSPAGDLLASDRIERIDVKRA